MKLSNLKICNSIFSQARGLMFSPKRNLVMVFPKEKKVSLHMFFVFYPIDVYVLDRNKRVIEFKRDFQPFTFWHSRRAGQYVVELAKNRTPVKLNEKIKF